MNYGGTNADFPKTKPMGPKYVWVPKNKTQCVLQVGVREIAQEEASHEENSLTT